MLEVMRDYFKLSPLYMNSEIQRMLQTLDDVLSSKGISYSNLRSALVPDRKRREIALVFDTMLIESGWYGLDVFQRIIPLLEKKSNHSILTGDYLNYPGKTKELISAFQESVQLRRNTEFHHPTQFYIVYINNLTNAMIRKFDDGLANYEAYIGFADTTYASLFKFYLSNMLVNLGIKHGSIFIQGHEADRPDTDDVNMCAYPFEEAGFICRSVSSDLEGVFLSYKIERPVLPGFEIDTEFALNAISLLPLPLDDFKIEVEEAKLAYVKSAKNRSIERAGLKAITSAELAQLIKEKISASYIYNLEFLEEHDVAKFNIIIQLPSKSSNEPTRLLAALEYKPEQKTLRLITLF